MSKTYVAASVAVAALLAPAAALALNTPPAPYRTGPGPHAPAPAGSGQLAAGPLLLPDFPAEAKPGECWTRVPVGPGGQVGAPPAGQPVWTLKRGYGPEAVWRFDRRPMDGALARGFAGPYEWVRVACSPGDAILAEAPPPPPAPPAPPQAPAPHGPMQHRQMHGGPMMQAPQHPGPMVHGAPPPQGPMMHGPMHHGPLAHAPMAPQAHFAPPPMQPPHHGPYAGGPMPPPVEPAYLPPPAPPRWFGDRFLTWAGKTGW